MKKYILSDINREKYFSRVEENIKHLENELNEIDNKYVDPDLRLEEEVNIDDIKFRLAPDGICGVYYLRQYYDGKNTGEKLSNAYFLIRKKVILWPKHRQSINQRRYASFRDRLDFTLYDIKQFFCSETGESKLVREGSVTASFLRKNGNFISFIKEYELEKFVDGENVKNLETGGYITSYEQYSFSKESNEKYLNGLIKVLK